MKVLENGHRPLGISRGGRHKVNLLCAHVDDPAVDRFKIVSRLLNSVVRAGNLERITKNNVI